MGVPKVILMKTNDDGTKDQVYPVTHIEAVNGLKDALKGKDLNLGVKTINGQSGDITLPVLNDSDYARIMTMVTAFENGEIGSGSNGGSQGPKGDKGDKGDSGGTGSSNLTYTKVGEI